MQLPSIMLDIPQQVIAFDTVRVRTHIGGVAVGGRVGSKRRGIGHCASDSELEYH